MTSLKSIKSPIRMLKGKGPLVAQTGLTRDQRRYQSNPKRRWYSLPEWFALRRRVLKRDNYTCQRTGVLLVGGKNAPDSPIVHHKTPHRFQWYLFIDENNCEAVSKEWHDKQGQLEDIAHGASHHAQPKQKPNKIKRSHRL